MLSMTNINKNYKKEQVLFDFSADFELDQGIIYGLIGPNGAGKTTALKLLANLLDHSTGSITLSQEDFKTWSRKNIIFIPAGERGLRYKNTVYDNIMYFSAMKGLETKKTKVLLEKYGVSLGFEPFLKRRVETLSTGQKKKAALLCGLCMGMRLVLMDEPTNGLDIGAQEELKSIVAEIARRDKVTFLISSHDLNLFSNLAGRYLFLFHGHIVCRIGETLDAEAIRERYEECRKHGSWQKEKAGSL